jgi:hypothetical protein
MMKARGYAFIPLEEALRDDAYRSADTWAGTAGITWLPPLGADARQVAASLPGEPKTPAWILRAGAGGER